MRVKVFAAGFVLGAVSVYVALAWTGGLMPPAARAPSREPGDSTDVPRGPLDPPLDFTRPSPAPGAADYEGLQARRLAFPVEGYDVKTLRDNFAEMRGDRVHEAIDILAPRGTPVVAVDDGEIEKLFSSARGGLTIYHFDPSGRYSYYYAHLDRYAEGLAERQKVRKGQRLGYVGTSGNAAPDTPHLHFTVFKLGADRRWWEGSAVNPFPLWALPPQNAAR